MSDVRGFSLLEVLVALAILSSAGLALIEVSAQAIRTATVVTETEAAIRDEDRLLSAYTLLNRRDLETRLGSTVVGRYTVGVERIGWDVFRISVAEGGQITLATAIYRGGAADAPE